MKRGKKPSQVIGKSEIIKMILPKLLFFNTKLLLLPKNKLSEWNSVRNCIRFASSVLNCLKHQGVFAVPNLKFDFDAFQLNQLMHLCHHYLYANGTISWDIADTVIGNMHSSLLQW